MANEFVQTMADARVDARSLSEFVFKPAGFKVARRLALPVDTLQFYIDRFDATKATTDAYVATIPNVVNDAINNTAVEGGVLADTFVTVTANGTGSVARTQRDKNSDVVSVKDFGAVGDGVTDDRAAIQSAINYLAGKGGGVVNFAAKKYTLLGKLDGRSKVSLQGANGTVLDFGKADPILGFGKNGQKQVTSYIQYKGTAKSGALRSNSDAVLSADGLKGSLNITVNNVSAFNVGDLIEISADTDATWIDTIRVTIGQLVRINKITGNILMLSDMLDDSYNMSDSASVRIIKPCSDFFVSNLTVIGGGNGVGGGFPAASYAESKGLGLYFCTDFEVRNCSFIDCMAWAIRPTSCLDFEIAANKLYCPLESGVFTGAFYGIAYACANKNGVIKNNAVIGFGSGIISSHLTMSLTEQYVGINRDITIEGNSVYALNTGISMHQDAERIGISRNSVISKNAGVRVRSSNVSVDNNTIRVTGDSGNGVLLSHQPSNASVDNNKITSNGALTGIAILLTQQGLLAGFTPSGIKVTNNTIYDFKGGSHIIGLDFPAIALSTGNIVSGNIIRNCEATTVNSASVYLRGKTTVSVKDNDISKTTGLIGVRLSTDITATVVERNKLINIGESFCFVIDKSVTKSRVVYNEYGGYGTVWSGYQVLDDYSSNIDYGSDAM